MNRPVLLDTQIIIWLFERSRRITAQVQTMVDNPSQDLVVSYVSLMEMAIKASTGKLAYSDTIYEDLAMLGVELLMPGRQELRQYRLYSPKNKDPFDNFLIATAIEGNMTFLTADKKILETKANRLQTIDARM